MGGRVGRSVVRRPDEEDIAYMYVSRYADEIEGRWDKPGFFLLFNIYSYKLHLESVFCERAMAISAAKEIHRRVYRRRYH